MKTERDRFAEQDLFTYLRQVSKEYWLTHPPGPPQYMLDRDDLVPIGLHGWEDGWWICLRRDGRVVVVVDGQDTTIAGHNQVVGMLMQRCAAASAYLRPPADPVRCPLCRGSGRYRAELCSCGGLGWVGPSPY